jgi:oligopeptide/dipeptide ABC transporter ATP-binding protein
MQMSEAELSEAELSEAELSEAELSEAEPAGTADAAVTTAVTVEPAAAVDAETGGQHDHEVPIIETQDVTRHFSVGHGGIGRGRATLKAVDGVSLSISRGETLALVGETGSGKTTFGRLLLGLYKPTGGDILYRGSSMVDPRGETARSARRHIQGVFQDPYSSLNPTMTVGQSLAEVLKVHKITGRRERQDTVSELMRTVGLSPAQAARRPQAFSGGERQRIGIARALAARPEVIIADEPLSALDVSIQAQVLNLLIELQQQQRLTYLFVTHDLDVAKHISQRTAVMYLGRVVEYAPTTEIFAEPLHPYTQALVKAAPRVTTRRKTIKPALTGDIPNAIERPSGCHFHPRCPFAMPVCSEVEPKLITVPGGRSVACHLHDPQVTSDAAA